MKIELLLRIFLLLGGITLGYMIALIRRVSTMKKSSDGEITLRNIGGAPTIVLNSCKPISQITEKGYAVFLVDPELLELDKSRDI